MKKLTVFLLALFCLLFGGCGGSETMIDPMGYSFSLTWNCYGISSYDSESGRLVKTTDATNPDDYVTTLVLTEQQLNDIAAILSTLDLSDYPDEYDPGNGDSEPSMTLILTVRSEGIDKTIACRNISLSYESKDRKGQKFLTACRDIIDILTATDEWKSLPEYEFFYD